MFSRVPIHPSARDVPDLRGADACHHLFQRAESDGSAAYFAAGRSIKGWQNGLAVAGDYMSAASFLAFRG
jgi:Na+(H+)/acetate symporter ActP